jgi:hypothetical protein
MVTDVRWKQRFDNFDRAFALLREALAGGGAQLNPLEREGHVWTDMLRQRNLLAHTYNLRHSEEALAAIETRYLAEMAQLHAWLAGKLQE